MAAMLHPPVSGVSTVATGEPHHYSISQAAALLGISRGSVWRWIRAGRLPATRLGHRTIRIKHEDLERLFVRLEPAGSGSQVVRPRTRLGGQPPGHRRAGVSAAPSGPARTASHRGAGQSSLHPDWRAMRASEHFVQFYEQDAFLLDAVAEYIGVALRGGEGGIVIATPAHVEGIEERLRAEGADVAAARAAGRYVALDAAETLAQFVVDGAPDPGRFVEVVGGLIRRVRAAGEGTGPRAGGAGAPADRRRLRIFGEMVVLLALEGNHAAALRLEGLWNELRQTQSFSLFCAYPIDRLGSAVGGDGANGPDRAEAVDGEAVATLVRDVCAAHTRVVPAESYTTLPGPDERLGAIAVLQQKARWLEAEIVARQRAEERLRLALASERAARAAAEQALRVRDEFLSVAAHELRTPVTSLSGYAQLLLRSLARDGQGTGSLQPARVVSALQAITGQAKKLTRLVGQLLDLSRLDGGTLRLERQRTDLRSLVEQVVAGARLWSARHAITLEAPASLDVPVDPLRLEQVLTNLLDNAIKYSPEGGPIEVGLARRADGGHAVAELSVRDHGIGIPLQRRGRIFERFYQAHVDGHRSGMGLGLAISRQIVELHGGEIWAEFPPDGGTRVLVRLPVEAEPDEPADPGAESAG